MMKSKCSGKTKSGKNCKNDVSVEGETFCPTHGGETKASHEEKQKYLRKQNNQKQNNQKQNNQKQNPMQKQKHAPMQKQKQNPSIKKKTCEKICSTTKKQCKLFVSLKGEKFCPRHGGLTKSGVVMKSPRSPIPWAALHSACLNFVIVEHSLCKCEPRISPCKSMQIIIWLQQLSSLVSLKKSGKSTYPSVSALRKWIEKAPLDKMNFQELLLHASRILQVANTRWLRDLLNDRRSGGSGSGEEGGEGEVESDKNDEKNVDGVEESGSDGVGGKNGVEGEEEGENDEGENDDEEEELNGENEKGKEELNDVEMMDQDDDEVIEGGEVEDGEQDEEEYVPSSSSVKRNVKKQKKRVKSEDDQDLNDNSSLKKTMIEEFKTQNSPAV
jgi:hypothetical protein